jgi:uroporphyrinogen decarboxylase
MFYVKFTETLCQFSRFGAINIGDDMGHKTGTLINPNDLRGIFVPWHRRIIQTAKSRGKLGFFHVCGQVEAIMDDLINTVGIDARHSTQDVIEPITISKQRWGERVALLGGVDVDFITRAKPEDLRTYTRTILEACVPGGGFAFGVGNWVADTIPIENYLVVLEEARRFM